MLTVTNVPAAAIRFSIVEEEKEIARAWLYIITNDLHEQPYGYLEDVFVLHEHRKQGHGLTLLKSVIEKAKELNCYKLIATSRLERERVHELYKKLNFQIHGYEFRLDL